MRRRAEARQQFMAVVCRDDRRRVVPIDYFDLLECGRCSVRVCYQQFVDDVLFRIRSANRMRCSCQDGDHDGGEFVGSAGLARTNGHSEYRNDYGESNRHPRIIEPVANRPTTRRTSLASMLSCAEILIRARFACLMCLWCWRLDRLGYFNLLRPNIRQQIGRCNSCGRRGRDARNIGFCCTRATGPSLVAWTRKSTDSVLKHCNRRRTRQRQMVFANVIGAVRRECLDYVIPLNESNSKPTLRKWMNYYNSPCPLQSLGLGIPDLCDPARRLALTCGNFTKERR